MSKAVIPPAPPPPPAAPADAADDTVTEEGGPLLGELEAGDEDTTGDGRVGKLFTTLEGGGALLTLDIEEEIGATP